MTTIEQAEQFREMVARLTEMEQREARAVRMGDDRRAEDFRREAGHIRFALARIESN